MREMILLCLLSLQYSALAQGTIETVVPFGLENQAGNSNDGILQSPGTFQQLFRASYLQTAWQTPVEITGIAFRVEVASN
jgi:hypothetical protein